MQTDRRDVLSARSFGAGSEEKCGIEARTSIHVNGSEIGKEGQGQEEKEGAWSLEVNAMGPRKKRFRPLLAEEQSLSIIGLGAVLVVLACGLWEVGERLCPKPQWAWLQYVQLHSFWHLAIGYGTSLMLQVSPPPTPPTSDRL